MTKNTIILSILSVVLLSSCSKEDCCCIPNTPSTVTKKIIDSLSFNVKSDIPNDTMIYKVKLKIGLLNMGGAEYLYFTDIFVTEGTYYKISNFNLDIRVYDAKITNPIGLGINYNPNSIGGINQFVEGLPFFSPSKNKSYRIRIYDIKGFRRLKPITQFTKSDLLVTYKQYNRYVDLIYKHK